MKPAYGRLNDAQARYLTSVVAGKIVADLGSGTGFLARKMADMGAKEVHAVDKENISHHLKDPRVRYHQGYIHHWWYPVDMDVVLVSWPVNYEIGLVPLLRGVDHVVYVGKNTDGTSCGTTDLFRYLGAREVLQYLPDRENVLIHYGSGPRGDPSLYHEEMCAIYNDKILNYSEDVGRKNVMEWTRPNKQE